MRWRHETVCVIPHSASVQKESVISAWSELRFKNSALGGTLRRSIHPCQSKGQSPLHNPTSLFSLPWLHQFTIIGILHDNWRMVAIPEFFSRTWERRSGRANISGRKRMTLDNVSRVWLKLYYAHDHWLNYYNPFLVVIQILRPSNRPVRLLVHPPFQPLYALEADLRPWSIHLLKKLAHNTLQEVIAHGQTARHGLCLVQRRDYASQSTDTSTEELGCLGRERTLRQRRKRVSKVETNMWITCDWSK